ncbi:MAG: flagellar type III secretion system pore protein FliP [Pseudomonadota bacterium]
MRLAVLLLVMLWALPVQAQSVEIDLGGDTLTLQTVQLLLLLTVLSIAPGLAIMITCFPFMVTVLAILRQAIGIQQSPPNMLLVSLALFLTWFVMEPVFQTAWQTGILPMSEGRLSPSEGVLTALEPFRVFMSARVNPDFLQMLADAAPEQSLDAGEPELPLLIPAFLLTEIQRAFEVGFLIFLPFLVIDLVIAAILMSLGMMMVPPVVVSLPFKLAFFVMADGWTMLAGALVTGYAT